MRDRLRFLHQAQVDSEGFSTVELNTLSDHEAAASRPDQHLAAVLQDAEEIRLEIQQIQNDVGELKDIHRQALHQPMYCAVTKRDANAVGADIKRRAEGVLQRLHMMNAHRGQLEAQRGTSDPTARIAGTQYQSLSAALQKVMTCYNDTELSHREACRRQIQRQLEVAGREVGEEELEDMMESEELHVFAEQLAGGTARSAALRIESRQRELLELQRRIEGVQELFLDVAVLVEEQGGAINNIQKNVEDTHVTLEEGVGHLERAAASDKNNFFKKLFCGCCPCYHS